MQDLAIGQRRMRELAIRQGAQVTEPHLKMFDAVMEEVYHFGLEPEPWTLINSPMI